MKKGFSANKLYAYTLFHHKPKKIGEGQLSGLWTVDCQLLTIQKSLQLRSPHKDQKQNSEGDSVPTKGRESMGRHIG